MGIRCVHCANKKGVHLEMGEDWEPTIGPTRKGMGVNSDSVFFPKEVTT